MEKPLSYAITAGGRRYSRRWSHPAELVDQACRRLFPLGFLACNVVYWIYYLDLTNFADATESAADNANQGKVSSKSHKAVCRGKDPYKT